MISLYFFFLSLYLFFLFFLLFLCSVLVSLMTLICLLPATRSSFKHLREMPSERIACTFIFFTPTYDIKLMRVSYSRLRCLL